MNEARDNPGVIAPPPLIALAALLLGLALDWLYRPSSCEGFLAFGPDSSLAEASLQQEPP